MEITSQSVLAHRHRLSLKASPYRCMAIHVSLCILLLIDSVHIVGSYLYIHIVKKSLAFMSDSILVLRTVVIIYMHCLRFTNV